VSGAHGHSAPDACSVGFDRAEVSAYGTAARATFFVALEQSGPWGRDAARQSHLGPELGGALSDACAERGGRLTLIRRAGAHPDRRPSHPDHASPVGAGTSRNPEVSAPTAAGHAGGPDHHTAYLAWCGPDPWLLEAPVEDPATLLDIDLDSLARGDREAVLATLPGAAAADPVVLVCTNGRRDVCCAVRGRPVALEAAAAHPGRVWEASHTGGHRFAPTGVLLPHGATLARLDGALCAQLLERAGHDELPPSLLGPRHDRGLSRLDAGGQVAEAHVRAVEGITSLSALTTVPMSETVATYAVSHSDGRSWTVAVSTSSAAPLRESCGKAAVPLRIWTAHISG